MELTWDLEVLYKGYEDPKYIEDSKKIIELINIAKEEKLDINNKVLSIEKHLEMELEISKLIEELFSYNNLRVSTNVNDYAALAEMGKLRLALQETVASNVAFTKFLKDVDLDALAKESEVIKNHLFVLKEEQSDARHMLSDSEEILASKLQLVGSSGWSQLQGNITSNLVIDVEGYGNNLPLPSVRNMAYSNDANLRKAAYLAEINAYKRVEDAVAMALNNIKREVNIMMPLRHYESALEKTLEQSRMSTLTLNAMIEAIKEEAPRFREYLRLKGKMLGHNDGIPFYDMFAPVGKLTKEYSILEAKELVLDAFGSFSKPLYDLGYEAFNNRWIDFLPREGKRGGAFCAGLDNHNQSRVLTNFTGSLADIQTLAHELGHAYHGRVVQENSPLNRSYPMPLAETASIFCQTLMSKKMIAEITDPMEKLTVVEVSLSEDTQCVIDILSRFIFESEVLNTPISKPLSAKELCEMMLNAQEASYGNGLAADIRHPYMWVCKSHYYSAGLNFYNFPYAFGLLYGKGLYKQYLKDKEAFVKNYDKMLQATGYMSVEDVAKTMGIDVTNKEFWIESLKFIEEEIDLFEELLNELKLV